MTTAPAIRFGSWLELVLIILAWACSGPVAALAQSLEEENSETIQFASVPLSARQRAKHSDAAELIVEKTNAMRKEEGLANVQVNSHLRKAAEYFANYMATTNKYGHTADGKRPLERAKEFGYEYCIVSENIAYQYNSAGFATGELAEQFFQIWANSSKHRQNMLDPDVMETGVAVAQSKDSGYYYAVQMFGRPKSMSIRFDVENRSDVTIDYRIGERTFPLPPHYTRTHEQCRPADLIFEWPQDASQKSTTLRPKGGEKLVVSESRSGKWVVKVQ